MMGLSKYNVKERKIARKVYRLKEEQRRLRNKWLDIDVKINALKHKLNKKYGEKC